MIESDRMKDKFVNLHVHSDASVGDSVIKIPDLVNLVESYNQDYVALTDHSSTANWYALQQACKDTNVKPIFGNEFYCKTTIGKPVNRTRYHLICLAQNEQGAKNIRMMQDIAVKHKYYKPLLPHQVLKNHSEGVFVTTACALGYVSQKLYNNKVDKAYDFLNFLLDTFGKDNVAIELQYHPDFKDDDGNYVQNIINERLIKMYEESDTKWIINTFDSHCLLDDDRELRRRLQWKNWKKPYEDISETLRSNILGNSDLTYQFAHETNFNDDDLIQKAINNTHKIAEKCYFDMKESDRVIPLFNKHREFKKIFLKKVV